MLSVLIKMLVGTIRNEPLIIIFLMVSSHNQDKNYHLVYSFAYFIVHLHPHIKVALLCSKIHMEEEPWKCCTVLRSILLPSLSVVFTKRV